MKNIVISIGFISCTIINATGQQAPAIAWQNTIGGSDYEELYSTQQTSDGGYILGGFSKSNISGDKTENCLGQEDYWVVKTDAAGNIQWQNTIGGSDADWLNSISQTANGGYICGGYSRSNISGDKTENCIGNYDYWIVKLDAAGTIEWQNTIGGSNTDWLYSVSPTADGGYICGGYSNSNISGDKSENSQGMVDYWVVKLDSLGSIQWQNTIGGSGGDLLISLSQTADGGYICGGASTSGFSGDKTEINWDATLATDDYWIVKLNASGAIQWQNTIGGSDSDLLYSIAQTADGGYICGGSSLSNASGDKTESNLGSGTIPTRDYWLLKLDASGSIQWQNTIGGGSEDLLQSVSLTSDGGYICGGPSWSDISGDKSENSQGAFDYWIIKLDASGNIQWQNTIGGNAIDVLFSVSQTADSGYICGGISWSPISGDKTENSMGGSDYWLVKLYPDTITSISDFGFTNSDLNVFPNPFTNEITISHNYPNYLNRPNYQITITDIFGKEVLSQQLTTVNSKLQTVNLPAGVYFVKVNSEVKKIIKLK